MGKENAKINKNMSALAILEWQPYSELQTLFYSTSSNVVQASLLLKDSSIYNKNKTKNEIKPSNSVNFLKIQF